MNTKPHAKGFTEDIPSSPLDFDIKYKVMEETADDDDVNLSQWVLLKESDKQARACIVLSHFTAKWWRY